MLKKIQEFLKLKNKEGFFLPTISDTKTGAGSVSLTLVFVSFNLCVLGIIGKWSKILDVDVNQALNLFMVCAGLYWGRKFQNTKDGVNIDADSKEKE